MIAAVLSIAFQAPDFDANAAWSETRKIIETRYFARKTRGEEMVRRLDEAEPKAKGAKTVGEFDAVVDEMIRGFGDSHFGFFVRSEPGFYLMDALVNANPAKFPSIGAWLDAEPNGLRVRMVLNGGEAEKKGVRPGDLLVLPDGKTVDLAGWSAVSEVRLEVEREGKRRPETFHPVPQTTLDMFLDATQKSVRILPAGERKLGYVRIWTMANNRFPQVLREAMEGDLKGVNGLIVDLRDGFGGRPEATLKAIAELPKDLPIVALINGGTRSAKEVTAARLKSDKRAILVGSRTAGHVIGTFPYRMKGDWAYLEVPMVAVDVNGVNLEKNGVEPDIAVPIELAPDGTDLVIQQAVKLLYRKTDEVRSR